MLGPATRRRRPGPRWSSLRYWETVGNRVCRSGMRLLGCRHEAEPYKEERPDAFCDRCCAWGHVGPRCTAAATRCSFLEEEHMTADHRCPVDGCRAKKGCSRPHVTAKCRNCRGQHLSLASVCRLGRRHSRTPGDGGHPLPHAGGAEEACRPRIHSQRPLRQRRGRWEWRRIMSPSRALWRV